MWVLLRLTISIRCAISFRKVLDPCGMFTKDKWIFSVPLISQAAQCSWKRMGIHVRCLFMLQWSRTMSLMPWINSLGEYAGWANTSGHNRMHLQNQLHSSIASALPWRWKMSARSDSASENSLWRGFFSDDSMQSPSFKMIFTKGLMLLPFSLTETTSGKSCTATFHGIASRKEARTPTKPVLGVCKRTTAKSWCNFWGTTMKILSTPGTQCLLHSTTKLIPTWSGGNKNWFLCLPNHWKDPSAKKSSQGSDCHE